MPFEGPIWEDLYARYGKDDQAEPSDWDRSLRDPPFIRYFHLIADDLKELWRIGIPRLEVDKVTIGILVEKNEMGKARTLLRVHVYAYDKMVELAKYLFDIQAMVALRRLEDENFFLDYPDDRRTRFEVFRLGLAYRTSYTIFSNDTTNALGWFVRDPDHDVHLGLVEYLMDSGPNRDGSPFQCSPMLLALTHRNCLPVMELMAKRNAPFRNMGSESPFVIPDTLFVAMYDNPNMLPFLLKVGGMALEVPFDVWRPESYRYIDKNDLPFVCCELRRFRGMLDLMAEFSLILPLCAKCKDASHLESSIPSLQSICRMTYRSYFSPSQLLADDFPLPEHYPELYCEYLRFEDSPFDSPEFKAAMAERNPEEFQGAKNFLVPGEDKDVCYQITNSSYSVYDSDSGESFDDEIVRADFDL